MEKIKKLAFHLVKVVGNELLGTPIVDVEVLQDHPTIVNGNTWSWRVRYAGMQGRKFVKQDAFITVNAPELSAYLHVYLPPKPDGGNAGTKLVSEVSLI